MREEQVEARSVEVSSDTEAADDQRGMGRL
jgi:hypothetical protein